MHIHILGICGTFMGGVAAIAQSQGHRVTGSDQNVYPPMSDILANLGIAVYNGYDEAQFAERPDLVIIGNALSRGNPAVEYVLNHKLNYASGAGWLGEHFLRQRKVIAVAGTHGKTTTTAMTTHILQEAGLDPGYLIGGKAHDLDYTAYVGTGPFVIEADEYDTAFFDKRAKFVHYRPDIAILNNLEFDHADIYPDLASIQRQFHHLIRSVPGSGQLLVNAHDKALSEVLEMGVWSAVTHFGQQQGDWQYRLLQDDASHFQVWYQEQMIGEIRWQHTGQHNASNAVAAIAAAHSCGVEPANACAALSGFGGVKRRMEVVGEIDRDQQTITIYDDFAHHPTAIATTLQGLRQKVGEAKILVALEMRSNTMQSGHHQDKLAAALRDADAVAIKSGPKTAGWNPHSILDELQQPAAHFTDTPAMLDWLQQQLATPCHIVFMSNGGFDAASRKFLDLLQA